MRVTSPLDVGVWALAGIVSRFVKKHPGIRIELSLSNRMVDMGAEGIDLTLVRESSWANIRDRVAVGHFDVAHMLAPMPIASTLGLTPIAIAAPSQAADTLSTTTTATPSTDKVEYGDDFYVTVDVPSSDGSSAYRGTSTLYVMEAGSLGSPSTST